MYTECWVLLLYRHVSIGFYCFHCCFREFDAAAGLSCICFPQIESNSGSSSAVELCCFELHLLYRPGHYDILYI